MDFRMENNMRCSIIQEEMGAIVVHARVLAHEYKELPHAFEAFNLFRLNDITAEIMCLDRENNVTVLLKTSFDWSLECNTDESTQTAVINATFDEGDNLPGERLNAALEILEELGKEYNSETHVEQEGSKLSKAIFITKSTKSPSCLKIQIIAKEEGHEPGIDERISKMRGSALLPLQYLVSVEVTDGINVELQREIIKARLLPSQRDLDFSSSNSGSSEDESSSSDDDSFTSDEDQRTEEDQLEVDPKAYEADDEETEPTDVDSSEKPPFQKHIHVTLDVRNGRDSDEDQLESDSEAYDGDNEYQSSDDIVIWCIDDEDNNEDDENESDDSDSTERVDTDINHPEIQEEDNNQEINTISKGIKRKREEDESSSTEESSEDSHVVIKKEKESNEIEENMHTENKNTKPGDLDSDDPQGRDLESK